MSFLEAFTSTMGILTAIALFILVPLLLMYVGAHIYGDEDGDGDNDKTKMA